MTRYERLKGFKKGDKVWVSAIDFVIEYLRKKNGKTVYLAKEGRTFFPKHSGIITKKNRHLTKIVGRDGEMKCYTVDLGTGGFFRLQNVSECFLERRMDE